MQKINVAPSNAEHDFIKIKKITRISNEPVYNMEVKNVHNFAINDGLIVHNCIDAIRYACFRLITQGKPDIAALFTEQVINNLY